MFAVTSLLTAAIIPYTRSERAYAATNSNINFQARILQSNGAVVPDGAYNVEFNLYSVASGGSSLWTETYLNNASQGIVTKNGYITASLGSLVAFPNTIPWDQDLWIGMTVRGTGTCAWGSCTPADAEMTPRMKVTAVPYAFRAAEATVVKTVNGANVSTLGLVAPTGGTQVFQIQDQTAAGTYNVALQSGLAQTFSNVNTFSAAGVGLVVTNNATVGGALGVTGLTTATGGLTTGAGSTLTVGGATVNNTLALGNFNYSGSGNTGSIGSAASTVDIYTNITIAQTTAGQTLTIPAPTSATSGRVIYVTNVGSAGYTMAGSIVSSGATMQFVWSSTTSSWSLVTSGVSGSYIQNGTATQTANMNIQSNSTAAVTATIQGANSQTANILEVKAAGVGTPLFSINAAGDAVFDKNASINGNTTIGDATTDRLTVISQILGGSPLVFQGATDNAFTTTLAVTDPTANNTITFPDASGTVQLAPVSGSYIQQVPTSTVANTVTPATSGVVGLTVNGTNTGTAATALAVSQPGAAAGITIASASNTATNGLSFSGTFTNLINSTNFNVTNAGAVTAVGVDSGSGLIQGTGGLTVAGAAASINDNSNFNTSINGGTSTGGVTIGNSAAGAILLQSGTSITLNANTTISAGKTLTVTSALTSLTGATTGDALNVNNSTSTGNIAVFQDNGTAVFTIGDFGDTLIKTNGNRTNAFRIQRSSADNIFAADSSANRIKIGNDGAISGADTTLFVLDTATTANQPTGTNGGMFYDTTLNKFRCYENGAWKDCDTGVTTVGPVSGTSTANGATITGTTLNLAVADGTNAGLVSTVAQTFAGAKTFSALITGNAGATISGAAASINDNSNFNTTINTGTSTGTVTIGSANAGAISLQSGSGIALTGTTTINTTGTANTTIGNATGTFQLTSSGGLNVSTAGVLTGVSGITTSGAYTQSGAGINSFTGNVGINNASAPNPFTLNAVTTSNATTTVSQALIATNGAGNVGLTIQGAASRTVSLAEFQNSTGTSFFSIGAGGTNNVTTTGSFQSSTGFAITGTAVNSGNISKTMPVGTGGVNVNDVVILNNDGGSAKVMQTTTARDTHVYGVSASTVASGSNASIVIHGNYQVTADTGAVAIGDQLVTSTTAGQVMVDNNATTGIIGIATTAKAGGASGLVGVSIQPFGGTVNPNLQAGNITTTGTISSGLINGQTISSSANFTGTVTAAGLGTFSGGLTIATGQLFTNGGATLNTALALGDLAAGPLGTAGTTVDVATSFTISPTASGRTYTIPSPTTTTAGRIIYITNINGTNSFIIGGATYNPGTSASYIWDGAAWRVAGFDAGVNTVGGIDTQTKSSNGAVIIGNNIYLQTADASNVGLVSTGAQTFAGAKTFSSLLTGSAGTTISGATISLNDSSNFNTSINGGSSTGSVSIGNALSGDVNIQTGASSNINLTTNNSAGGVVVKSAVNSTAVFQIQNSSGSTGVLFNADTVNSRISIGNIGTATGQLFVSGSLPAGSTGSVATGITTAQRVVVQGVYAYVNGSQSGSKLRAYDVSDPANPVALSNSYTDANGNAGNELAVVGSSAYVVSGDRIVSINIANQSVPTLNGTGNINNGNGLGIAVSGKYVFTTSGSDLQSFDVSSATPTSVQNATILNGSGVVIRVQGQYLYVGTSTNVQVINIANPASMSSSGTVAYGSAVSDLKVVGRYVYAVSSAGNNLKIYDVKNPAVAPVNIGTYTLTANCSPNGINVQGRLAYIACNGTANVIQVVDVSNPASPSSLGTISVGAAAKDVFVAGRYAYVIDGSNNLKIFDLGGAYIQQLETGGLETVSLSVDGNAQFAGDVSIRSGLQIGGSLDINAGMGVVGGAISLNASSNFATNINTGTSTGAVSIGNAAAGNITLQSAGTLALTGTTTINTTGTANTTIGNATGTFQLTSNGGLNVSTAGALTGVSGITTSGAYTQSGTSANTLTGATNIAVTDANAFRVQSAAAADTMFNIDTTANMVKVGNNTGTGASTTLLVLDSSSTSAGLSTTVGAMYYDTTAGRIQCYEGTSWGNCGNTTLQEAYNSSVGGATAEVVLDSTRGAFTIRDNTTPLGTNLLEIQNNAGTTTYFGVSATGVSVSGDVSFASGANRTISVANAAVANDLTVSAGGATGINAPGGALFLQGGIATNGNANGGSVTVSGGAGVGTGVLGVVNVAAAAFSPSATVSFGASNNLNALLANATNNYSTVPVNATASGLTLTVDLPTVATVGRILYVTAVNGSNDFGLLLAGTSVNISMKANSTATLIYNGTGWTAAGASSSTTLQAAYANTLTSAGGAEIVLNAPGGAADGLTVRNNATPIIGALFEVQSSIGSNLFSVNNNATEYANNGGAEDSTFTMWSASPTGGSTATVSRESATANYIATGVASTKVVTTGATTANQGVANKLSSTLTANLQYTVSFSIKGTTSLNTLDVYYSKDGTNTSPVNCSTGNAVTVSGWTRVGCTFTAPSSGITSNNAIFIRQSDSNTVAATYYIDNLSVTVNASVNHAVDGSVDSALGTNWVAIGGSVTRDTSVIYDTSASVAATTGAAGRGVYNNLTNAITPAVSTQYRVSFYARGDGTNNATIAVNYSRDGGSTLTACQDYNTQTALAASFTLITCYFTTDGTAPTAAQLRITQTGATPATFYVDALNVTLNNNNASNVQIGGGSKGGPATLLTLDRSSTAPIAANNDAYLGSMYYDTTTGRIQCYEADGWGACGSAPDNIVNLNPEYAGAVLNGGGVGTMTADLCANSGALSVNSTLCASGQSLNFYRWTSPQATQQTYSIYVNYQLPSTFKSFASDNTVQLTGRVDSTTNAAVTYQMYVSHSGTITQCGTGETNVITTPAGGAGSANTWYTYGINGNESTGCPATGGDYIIFKINLKANSSANAYVSTLSFTTTGK